MKKKRVFIAIDVARDLRGLLLILSEKRQLNGRQRALIKHYAAEIQGGIDRRTRTVGIQKGSTVAILKYLVLLFDRRHDIRRIAESIFGWFK